MERVVILGSGGAGKSWLASEIAERTGLPLVHLDALFWRAGWTPAPEHQALADLQRVITGSRWILDGNFFSDPADEDIRFGRADTVIFLDPPRWKCLCRIAGRMLRERGRSRPDLPPGCVEGFDLPCLRWVWSYPKATRPAMLELIGRVEGRAAVHHLRTDADVRAFLSGLSLSEIETSRTQPESARRHGRGRETSQRLDPFRKAIDAYATGVILDRLIPTGTSSEMSPTAT